MDRVMQTRSYQLLEPLGEGGMGEVFRAFDAAMDRDVALKILKADVPEPYRQRFEREARVGARFSHGNLVRVLDYGTLPDRRPWLAMEFLDGRDVGELIDVGGRLGVPVLVDVFTQTLDALEHVHARHIVHRDVKPSNLFVTRDPHNEGLMVVKLIDFGICRSVDAAPEGREFTGDPRYMPPEQAHGEIDPRTDLYALGISFYEAATGRHPYERHFAGAVDKLLMAHLQGVATQPSQLLPGGLPRRFGHDVDRIWRRACALDPRDRFSGAAEMRSEIAALAQPTVLQIAV